MPESTKINSDQLKDEYALASHNHDSAYAAADHDHDSDYAAAEHSHSQYTTTGKAIAMAIVFG